MTNVSSARGQSSHDPENTAGERAESIRSAIAYIDETLAKRQRAPIRRLLEAQREGLVSELAALVARSPAAASGTAKEDDRG